MTQAEEISRKRKEEFYVNAIDLSKAFDLVDRSKLMDVFKEEIGDANLVSILNNMYCGTEREFRTCHGYTKLIKYELGVKRGGIL